MTPRIKNALLAFRSILDDTGNECQGGEAHGIAFVNMKAKASELTIDDAWQGLEDDTPEPVVEHVPNRTPLPHPEPEIDPADLPQPKAAPIVRGSFR